MIAESPVHCPGCAQRPRKLRRYVVSVRVLDPLRDDGCVIFATPRRHDSCLSRILHAGEIWGLVRMSLGYC